MNALAHGLWVAALASALVGCGDGGAVAGEQGVQDRFGSAFAAVFNRSALAEPVEPRPGDVPTLNLTADPIDF